MGEIRPKRCEGRELTKDQLGRMLDDTPVREGGLCKCSRSLGVKYQASSPIVTDGAHGATVNVTDGR